MLTIRPIKWLRGAVLMVLVAWMVTGSGLSITAAGAATWSKGTAPDDFISLSCTSSTFCVSLTGGSDAMIFNGTSWTEFDVQGEFGWGWSEVSCAPSGSEDCVALSEFGVTYLYNGTTWEEASSGLPEAWDYAFSCGAADSCQALVWGLSYGDFYSWNGTTWTEEGATPTIPSSGAVDCVSASFCVAVAGHFVYTYNGTTWTSGTSLALATSASELSPVLDSVSCPSTTYCMVSDTYGETFAFNGAKWINRGTALPSAGRAQVSCASPTFCLAINAGVVAQYNGVEWSAPLVVQPSSEVGMFDTHWVACQTTTFCMLAMSAGDYAIYQGGQVARYPAEATISYAPKSPSSGPGSLRVALHLAGSPTPTGTAAVKFAGKKICHGSVVAGAYACKVPIAHLQVGKNKLTVIYSGNSVWESYSGSLTVTVRS